jgi:hypothetical protein
MNTNGGPARARADGVGFCRLSWRAASTFANAVKNPPKKKQSVGMIEAALIRYFQPEYNDKFKIKFPSTKLKTLKSCYDLDISALTVELDSSEVGVFMWSSSVSISNHHTMSFDLVAPLKRASFFNATGIKEMPGIIKATL